MSFLVLPIALAALTATPQGTPQGTQDFRPTVLFLAPAPKAEPNQATAIVVRAKPEWSTEEGFKFSVTRVAYMRRF